MTSQFIIYGCLTNLYANNCNLHDRLEYTKGDNHGKLGRIQLLGNNFDMPSFHKW